MATYDIEYLRAGAKSEDYEDDFRSLKKAKDWVRDNLNLDDMVYVYILKYEDDSRDDMFIIKDKED